MNSVLWLKDKGYFAEYKDLLGLKRIHDAAEAPTIYHPIDFYLTDDFRSYQALRYIENRLKKILRLIAKQDRIEKMTLDGGENVTDIINYSSLRALSS